MLALRTCQEASLFSLSLSSLSSLSLSLSFLSPLSFSLSLSNVLRFLSWRDTYYYALCTLLKSHDDVWGGKKQMSKVWGRRSTQCSQGMSWGMGWGVGGDKHDTGRRLTKGGRRGGERKSEFLEIILWVTEQKKKKAKFSNNFAGCSFILPVMLDEWVRQVPKNRLKEKVSWGEKTARKGNF